MGLVAAWRYLCVCTHCISQRAKAACLDSNLPWKGSKPIFKPATQFKRPCSAWDDSSKRPPSPFPRVTHFSPWLQVAGCDGSGRKGTAGDGGCDSEGTAGKREGCSPEASQSSAQLREQDRPPGEGRLGTGCPLPGGASCAGCHQPRLPGAPNFLSMSARAPLTRKAISVQTCEASGGTGYIESISWRCKKWDSLPFPVRFLL